MNIEHKKLTDLINVGVILLDEELHIHYWNHWIEVQTQKKYKEYEHQKIDLVFDIKPLHVKTLKRQIKTSLAIKSPSFFTADTKQYLIPIQNKLHVTSHNLTYMQQDITILPYDIDNRIVALLIHDQTSLISSKLLVQTKKEELEILNKEAHKTIEELKKAQDQLKEQKDIIYAQARYDQLTNLSNRTHLNEKADISIKDAKRTNESMAVLFIDLDKFKLVNDTMGHDAGDLLLKEVAKVLVENTRETDVVSRLGGDEFLILLKHIKNEDAAGHIAHKIITSIYNNKKIKKFTPQVTASIGISMFPQNGSSLSRLMKAADIALYQAKEKGRNNFQFFTKKMNDLIHANINLEKDMKDSLENGDFELYFQPKFNSKTLSIKSAEALIRWNHPTQKIISPQDFIPLAESTGFIIKLGTWIVEEACRKIKEWDEKGINSIKLSINLSAKQFEDEQLFATVKKALEDTKIDPEKLEFEITESIALKNMEKNIAQLKEFQKLGISVALDDFGTGYSSLSYLKDLPINTLKIDKSFMSEIPSNSTSNSLTKMIIQLANELNLQVVAEGIETDKQKNFLDSLGCNQYQGFLFAKPMPSIMFEALLKK